MIDPSEISRDAFVSDLFVSTREGNTNYDIHFPDSTIYDTMATHYDLDTVISKVMPVTYDVFMKYYLPEEKDRSKAVYPGAPKVVEYRYLCKKVEPQLE